MPVPALLCRHETKLIQWVYAEPSAQVGACTDHRRSRPARQHRRQRTRLMSLVKWTFLALLVLPMAEMAALILMAWAIGWSWAFALFIGTSVLGLLLLRKSGRGHWDRFRQAVSQRGLRAIHLETPGVAPIVGGILLVFPG